MSNPSSGWTAANMTSLLREMRDKLTDRTAKAVAIVDKAITDIDELFQEDGGSAATPARKQRATRQAAIGERGNMSQSIKSVFEQLGNDAKPKEVIAAVKEQFELDVSVGLVSSIKTKLRQGGSTAPAKRGRKPAADKPAAAKRGRKAAAATDGLPLPAILQGVLHDNPEGLKLGDLAVQCVKRGYVYTGKAKGDKRDKAISQNVYQAANSLMKTKERRGFTGTEPVVLLDETSHRYRLNPKAKKQGAA